MRNVLVFLLMVIFAVVAPSAHAVPFPATITLTESDNNDPVPDTGVVVQYDFSFSGTTLTVEIFNLSDTNFAPAIDGIGLDLTTENLTTPSLVDWTLTAFSEADLMETPPMPTDISGEWVLTSPGGQGGSFQFDYYSSSSGGVDYALYNPLVLQEPNPFDPPDPDLGNTPFFTTGVLTLIFDGDFSGITSAGARLQNVGVGTDGSLKLTGDPVPSTPPGVPEPATMLLLGTGLAGLASLGRKKFKK